MDDLRVLPGVTGILVTDVLGSYTIYGAVLRELIGMIEHSGELEQI
ncbi:hypothetical protein ACIBF5_31975 [Micromonospora sp. NPDC050417]